MEDGVEILLALLPKIYRILDCTQKISYDSKPTHLHSGQNLDIQRQRELTELTEK